MSLTKEHIDLAYDTLECIMVGLPEGETWLKRAVALAKIVIGADELDEAFERLTHEVNKLREQQQQVLQRGQSSAARSADR